jgi:hypothetical protein
MVSTGRLRSALPACRGRRDARGRASVDERQCSRKPLPERGGEQRVTGTAGDQGLLSVEVRRATDR